MHVQRSQVYVWRSTLFRAGQIYENDIMNYSLDGFHKVMNQVTKKQNYRKETHEFRLD